jgi:carboxylesterase type B
LNVYVPPGTTSTSKKSVMFWIYGGGLTFGDSGSLWYDGSSFASQQDVILVSHNYRTNGAFFRCNPPKVPRLIDHIVFGFPNSPEIPSEDQNVGFLDQRQALQWVQENIDAFGGDPSKVTIFGESAGAYSVEQLLAVPPSPIPFRGAIIESFGASSSSDGSQSWTKLATYFDCDQVVSPLDCMRHQNATAIKQTIEENQISFPTVFNGVTAVSDIRPLIEDGRFAHVPFMIGTNADEGSFVSYVYGIDDPIQNITAVLELVLGNSTLASLLVDTLGLAGQISIKVLTNLLTHLIMQCPSAQIASLATDHGYEVWRYFYNASFANEAPFPAAGAYHSSEIPQVFGTYPRDGSSNDQAKLSEYMQTAWAQFAKDPTHGPGWVGYGKKGNVEALGYPEKTGGSTVSASHLDSFCLILDIIIGL